MDIVLNSCRQWFHDAADWLLQFQGMSEEEVTDLDADGKLEISPITQMQQNLMSVVQK